MRSRSECSLDIKAVFPDPDVPEYTSGTLSTVLINERTSCKSRALPRYNLDTYLHILSFTWSSEASNSIGFIFKGKCDLKSSLNASAKEFKNPGV